MGNAIWFDRVTEQEREIMELRAENDALWWRISELAYEIMEARREVTEATLEASCAKKMTSYYRDKIKKIEEEHRIERAAAYAEIERILKR